MPNYDYKCNSCNKFFEQFHSINKRNSPCEKPCPFCNEQNSVQKITASLSSVAIDKNNRIDGNAKGGFRDVMQRIISDPSIKGTKAERYYKNRYGI